MKGCVCSLPPFSSLFIASSLLRKEPHQCLSTDIKDHMDAVEKMMPVLGNGQQRGPPSLCILLCRCLRWEKWQTILTCFQNGKARVSSLWIRGISAPWVFPPNPSLLCHRIFAHDPPSFHSLTRPHSILPFSSAIYTVLSCYPIFGVLFRNNLL